MERNEEARWKGQRLSPGQHPRGPLWLGALFLFGVGDCFFIFRHLPPWPDSSSASFSPALGGPAAYVFSRAVAIVVVFIFISFENLRCGFNRRHGTF